jgi:pentatricopeptide repeat protein
MSFFCSFSPSTAGTLVSKVAHRQVLSFLTPSESAAKRYSSRRTSFTPIELKMVSTTTPTLEQWFIKSLATASLCSKHNPRSPKSSNLLTCQRPHASLRKEHPKNINFRRQLSTQVAVGHKDYNEDEYWENQPNPTKEELLQLIDQYSGGSPTAKLPKIQRSAVNAGTEQPDHVSTLSICDKVEDEWPPPNHSWPTSSETEKMLKDLQSLVLDMSQTPEMIYQKYRELPQERAAYLKPELRHQFLRRLYTIQHKDEQSMLRYLSVVDDMKNAAIPLTTIEWNSAISFAARYVAKSTEVEVEGALHMWQEMEQVAGIVANDATFNILFDVACKAGKFALAEMIYSEMEKRGLRYNRFHHVSLIHFHGLQRNGDGARAAYNALVEAGEIVDTVVLNAMISALISSYEANAAENTYERMKRMHKGQAAPKLPPKDYLKQRAITRSLKRIAIVAKSDAAVIEKFQKKSIVAPDLHTYRILVNYYATQAGDLAKTAKLLEEMKMFELPVHGALFLALFKGFALHGGIRYTDWTSARLESVWTALLSSIDGGQSDLHISRWMVAWALRAFSKCSGSDRTLAAWDEVKKRWQPNEMEVLFVMEMLKVLVQEMQAVDRQSTWILGM